MKIVCLGDSLTWGQYGGSYVDALARLLPQHSWINAGVGGDTVINLLRRIENDVLPHQPDEILVMVGGNDAISNVYPATRPYYKSSKGIPDGIVTLAQFDTAYRDLLIQLQAHHVSCRVVLPPAEYSQALHEMLTRFNAQALQAAQSLNIPTLDLLTRFAPPSFPQRPPLGLDTIQLIGKRGREGWDDYEGERIRGGFTITFDGLHPTPEGAEIIAQHLAAFIAS
jgi:lysophospholipase L1-like esterase